MTTVRKIWTFNLLHGRFVPLPSPFISLPLYHYVLLIILKYHAFCHSQYWCYYCMWFFYMILMLYKLWYSDTHASWCWYRWVYDIDIASFIAMILMMQDTDNICAWVYHEVIQHDIFIYWTWMHQIYLCNIDSYVDKTGNWYWVL